MRAGGALSGRIARIEVSSTMRVAAEAERLKRAGADIVDFGAGEPDFPTPDNIKRAAVQALERNLTKYTNAGGTLELKQAICRRHAADFGTSYSVPECLVTVGGKHAVFNFIQSVVDPGDEVVIPVPYWVTYVDVVRYAGGKCVFAATDEQEGFALSAALVERHVTPRTRVIIINSPANPSGAVVDPAEFERLAHLAVRRGIWLLSDECYSRFVYDGAPFSVASVPGAKDHVLVAGSLSKIYSMTGWRIGYCLAPEPVITAVHKLQSHSTSNPTSIAQHAAVEALEGPQDSVAAMLAEYRKRRDYVLQRLRALPGVRVTEPRGAFYAYPNIAAASGEKAPGSGAQFAAWLLETAGVVVVPGEAFGTKSHVRISFATSMRELERGLDRMQSALASL